MTQADILFFLAILGAVSGVWWRVEGKIKEAKSEAGAAAGAAAAEAKHVRDLLAEFKVEAAQKYATRDESVAATDRLMQAIESVGSRVDRKLDSMTDRLDRVIETDRRHHGHAD